MSALTVILFLLFLVWIIKRPAKGTATTRQLDDKLNERNREWAVFIAGYLKNAKNKAQKEILGLILEDIRDSGVPVPELDYIDDDQFFDSEGQPENQQAELTVANDDVFTQEKAKNQIQLDNASLLLYFGAFLFVASAGLFVAFGGLSGGLRSLIVAVVTLTMYMSGIWLYENRQRLEQAGIAFAGIGVAIAPLIGLTVYKYLLGPADAKIIWFITSLLCLVMYSHAVMKLHKPLMNYVFIFTFLSLFESAVSITSAPIYYFGWMLALVGIVLSAISHLNSRWPEINESSKMSAMIYLPLSIIVSLGIVTTQGFGQLGVSFLLAAAFYGLEIMSSSGEAKQNNALAAHLSFNIGVGLLFYSAGHSLLSAAVALTLINAVEMIILWFTTKQDTIWQNYASVVIFSQMMALAVGFQHHTAILFSTFVLFLMSVLAWLKQNRTGFYAVAAISCMSLPLIFAQLVADPIMSAESQTMLMASSLLFQLLVLVSPKRRGLRANWQNTAGQVYMASALAVVIVGIFAGPWFSLFTGLLIATTTIYLAKVKRDKNWAIISGLFVTLPLVRVWLSPGALLATVLIALLANIAISLRYRVEPNRWVSTILWMILPVALGRGLLGGQWSSAAYAWAYLVVMIGLILSRAIARGVTFVSYKVPMASYARTASYSYVVGYWSAALAAVMLSLMSSNSQLHSSAILIAVTLLIWLLGRKVEKEPTLYMLLPIMIQAILASILRPHPTSGMVYGYLILSSVLAVVCYFALSDQQTSKILRARANSQKSGALVASFLNPLCIMFIARTLWPMPIGLLVAAILVYYHVRDTEQQNKELAGGLFTLSIFWFMGYVGINNIQAYSHVLVIQFALYSYWRYLRSETSQSDQYLYMMLSVATLPLVLQALSGVSGGLYGWWLLLEEVCFMIIGMFIGKRFVTMWGLYVAVAAVLYQLRGLGWAALTVLALFLIGLAVAKILKYQDR